MSLSWGCLYHGNISSSVIAAKLIHTGRGINLDLKKIEQSIGNGVSKALIGQHCLTGCDSVSAFYGKGKRKH